MSTLSYNGITINLIKTLGISHEPIRAEDESYLYTQVTIEVEGIVSGPPAQSLAPVDISGINDTLGNPISDTIRAIRHALLQERGLLVYNVGDSPTPLIVSPGLDANGALLPTDCNNGPVPGPLTIVRVDGISCFHVRYRIVTNLRECPGYAGADGQPSALISNRYSQAHTIDSNFYTSITTTGQAFFNTAVLEDAHEQCDHYRAVLFPPVPLGFKRMTAHIVATPSRNALTYQIQDVERCYDLGDTGPNGSNSNITDIDADYNVSSTGQGGAPVSLLSAHMVRCTVLGSKASSGWSLVKACFTVMQSKLPILDPSKGFLTQMSVGLSLTERRATLQATMMRNQQQVGQIPGIVADGLREDSVFPPRGGVNPTFPNRMGTAGTYQNEILASAWKSACQGPVKPKEGYVSSDQNGSDYSNSTGTIVTGTVTDDLPTYSPGYSSSTCYHPFTRYKIDMAIVTETGKMQVPIAGKVSGTTYSPGGGGAVGSLGSTGPDCEIITLARPTQKKVVEWSAERVGASPIAPSATPNDPNLVLIDSGYVQVCEPSLLTDGVTQSFSICGKYTYALKKCLAPDAVIPYPAPPWIAQNYGDVVLNPGDFVSGIIDA